MKETVDKRLWVLSFVYRSMLVFLVTLGLAILVGTIYGMFFKTVPQDNKSNEHIANLQEGQTFTGIGLLRVPTSDPKPGIVILFVSFSYNPDDKAFSEELVLRIRDFRDIISNYISSFSTVELQKQSEDGIKSELLRRFNTILHLGQINELYLSDFMIVG